MKNSKLCLITNIAPHYRLPIFKEMSSQLNCDFYSGDHIKTPIKTLDVKELPRYKATLHNSFYGPFYWQHKSIRLLFKPYQYYILDGEPYCLSSWAILLLARLMRKKTIAWTHGWYGRESFIKRILKRVFYSLFSKLMVYSEYSIDLMKKEGFKSEKLFCIANSLDSNKEQDLRKELTTTNVYKEHFHNEDPTIIYCGRLQKIKKLELILKSLKLLNSQDYPVNIVFIGKNVDGLHLENQAKSLNLSNQVWLYGPCYNDTILGELFYNAMLCVSPGNVGLTAIHSLSFGCPVITHNNFAWQAPEFESIIPGITGDFFEQDNIKDLSEKIRKWTSLTSDERIQTRQNAYQEIDRKWNIHYQIKIMKKVIHS
jgi:glycosyltransferase involved in cell wall biosynthesis